MSKNPIIVYVHVGHHGIGTGASSSGFDEVAVATSYARGIERKLKNLGIKVIFGVSDNSSYGYHWDRCNNLDCDVYIQCHVNSGIRGQKGHGITFYDQNSTPNNGPRLAGIVAFNLEKATSQKQRALSSSQPGYTRVAPCLGIVHGKSRLKAVTLLTEPFFLDDAENYRLCTDEILDEIASAVSNGIYEWANS